MKRRGNWIGIILILLIVIGFILAVLFVYSMNNRITGNVISTISSVDENISFETMKQVSSDLNNTFSKNYWVKPGQIYYYGIKDCVNAINTINGCSGPNPVTPYGFLLAPINPKDKYTMQDNFMVPDSNLSTNFRMRSDEAIVIIGITPPKSKFFSYIPYMFFRDVKNQKIIPKMVNQIFLKMLGVGESSNSILSNPNRFPYWASFDYNPPLNDETINTSKKSSGNFDGAFVIVITADKTIDEKIINELKKNILPKYGINSNIINTIKVPYNKLHMGYKNESDDFQLQNRIAYIENETLKEQYTSNPPLTVLRIVPNGNENWFSKKFSFEKGPNKNTNISEIGFQDSLDTLLQAVKLAETHNNRIENFTVKELLGSLAIFETCVRLGISCLGDDQDAMYAYPDNQGSPIPIQLKNNSDDFLIIVGMNHVQTGKAEYNNFALGNGVGVSFASINDKMTNGSARKYLSYIQNLNNVSQETKNELLNNLDKFIAYKISKACNNESYCYQIPVDTYICFNGSIAYFCDPPGTPGLYPDDSLGILERAYDDPLTNTGPSYEQLLPTYFVKYDSKN